MVDYRWEQNSSLKPRPGELTRYVLDVTPGTQTNEGRVAWDVNGTGVFVTSYLAFTNGTETDVLFDSKPGLKNLTTCRGDAGGGFTVIATGFLTPR